MDETREITINCAMEDFYFCKRTELSLHKGDSTVHPTEIGRLKVRDLLEHRVQAFGHQVKIEVIDNERMHFVFKGIDHNRTYHPDEPAKKLLDGIVHLGTYYDKRTGQFYF